ncbi:hypothetical protein ACFE04_007930 [Oxalis oulophora]
MGTVTRSGNVRKPNEMMRVIVTTIVGVLFGFFLGVSFPTLSITKMNLPTSLFPSIDITLSEEKYPGLSTRALMNAWSSFKGNRAGNPPIDISPHAKMWTPTNPRGAERLPPKIITSESDFNLRRMWGSPSEDITIEPKYLLTFTVGYNQRYNIDAAVKKFSRNFTVVLFHYDNHTSEWDEFEWSKQAIHVSVLKQTKWWYAKRFLHPDIVAPYEYIFMWDEDLGVESFDAEEYIKLVKKHGLEISQPGLDPDRGATWAMTKRRDNTEVHKETEERPGWCSDPHLPPCAAFVEIMATVFSRDAWRCVWYMIQNDLVHGWGLDFALRKCIEPAHEKIGVVDAQWIVHQGVPSLGNQGDMEGGKPPWQGVRERCRKEWTMFQDRMTAAEVAYYEAMVSDPAAEERFLRERRRKTLLKLKKQYQDEIDQWELLSNSLCAMQQKHKSLQSQSQLQNPLLESTQNAPDLVQRSEDASGSLVDELLLQAEAQEAIIHDVSNLCDVAEAMCDAQEERVKKLYIDLPVWSSPQELMAALCEE